MKNIRRIALLALVGASGSWAAHAQDTLSRIAQNNAITVAYRESSVPFSYLQDGVPIGFSADIASRVVDQVKKQLGKPNLAVNMIPVTSQNRIPLVKNGTVDLECGSTTNNTPRQAEVTFSVNHFYTATRILVKTSSGIKNYEDLKGKTLVATAGTSNVLTMRKYDAQHALGMDLIQAKDHAEALLLVESGRAAAFATDDIILFGIRSTSKNPQELAVVGAALNPEPYGCMIRKDDPAFKALVDGVVIGLMQSGEFEKLYDKWFMQPIAPYGKTLGIPMGKELQQNLKEHSDKPLS
ncbi:transporter substrate-binding domain-containing protein [Variovorax ginsengisoli]|uniref:Glutamate/aspartate transport system substrate-binding protein n=1 Tax=Variovorax ginsengisoli TaxID=363844 RepID=A0ABT9S872_9BURK|nr:transporter substrate-binding domain-containing protein [Variovorax ginsengisoli]MDP9899582.1 glutamate/aspartate transport system substrate-binding protein [Variovorax ginsengisoli]